MGLVFMKMTREEEKFIPLPEKYIKRSIQKIEDVDTAGKDYGNTEEERLGEGTDLKCFKCATEEDCGLFLTRAQKKAEGQVEEGRSTGHINDEGTSKR